MRAGKGSSKIASLEEVGESRSNEMEEALSSGEKKERTVLRAPRGQKVLGMML